MNTPLLKTLTALITLNPKIDHSEFINQFQLIPLSNVIYKAIFKVLVKLIKPLLDDRISPS